MPRPCLIRPCRVVTAIPSAPSNSMRMMRGSFRGMRSSRASVARSRFGFRLGMFPIGLAQ
jgi:hypothetical protein